MSVILATQEAENRIVVQSQHRFTKPYLKKKTHHIKGLVDWLKL
jgi:hypothetical protein